MKSRVRVVRLVPELDFGGVESRLALQAALIDRGQFDLSICGFWKKGAAAHAIAQLGIGVAVLDVPPRRSPGALRSLVAFLRREKPDVLHCSIAEANFLGVVAARLAGVPVVIAEEVGMPNHRLRARIAYALLYRQASAVVGVTDAVCGYLRDVDRAPASRVRRVYNCAHPRFFPEARSSCSRTREQQNTMLFVGRLHSVKNHETALRALALVKPEHPDARLVIAGDGPLRKKLEDLSRELGIASQVTFVGYRSDVEGLLRVSGALVLASHDEGCSISLIEAMASGLVALGSSVPGIREVLGGALSAEWTVPPSDVGAWAQLMAKYLAMPAEAREEIAASAQGRAYEVFSPQRYIEELQAMYVELLQASGVRR